MWVLMFGLLAMFQTTFSSAMGMKKMRFYKTRKLYVKLIDVIFWDRNHNSSQTRSNRRKQQVLHLHQMKYSNYSYCINTFPSMLFFLQITTVLRLGQIGENTRFYIYIRWNIQTVLILSILFLQCYFSSNHNSSQTMLNKR